MTRKDLNGLFKKVAKEVGFKKDPNHKGWMPKLGPGDYKSKIVHGFTDKGPVTLTVGLGGLVNLEALKLSDEYSLTEKKNNPCIVLPKVLDVGNSEDWSWVIRERVEGTVPLVNFPFSNSEERGQIAELYWNTVSVFSDMESENQPSKNFEDFVRERLNKWFELGEVCGNKKNKQKQEVFRNIADNMFRYIFFETDLEESADEMRFFFKNFGSTDMVFQDGKFYLPNSEIVFAPQFYGAAYFVWNILMHSYGRYDSGMPSDFIYGSVADEIELWRGEFYFLCPGDLKDKFHTAFYLLLFERVIATLLVDIPLRRSPFNEGAERAQKAEIIFVEVLKYLLNTIPTLVKNEPFEENILDLDRIYKA